jgi:hypothetical protein
MTTLTHDQRRARAAMIIAETELTGCTTLEAIERVLARIRAQRPREATRPAKLSKRHRRLTEAVTEALTAAQAPRPAPGTATATATRATQAAPAKPLDKMSGDELDAAAATAYRKAGGRSPFWQPVRESAPAAVVLEAAPPTPGVHQGPAGASLSQVNALVPPPPDPAMFPNMDNDSFLALSAAWFADHARQDHASPFWQAA